MFYRYVIIMVLSNKRARDITHPVNTSKYIHIRPCGYIVTYMHIDELYQLTAEL